MFDFIHLFMFVISTVGMAHIIVDSTIMEFFRDFVKYLTVKIGLPKLGGVVDCYLCCGVWCGFFMGYVWLTANILQVFACGCAGGFLSNVAAVLLNWVEAATIVSLPKDSDG